MPFLGHNTPIIALTAAGTGNVIPLAKCAVMCVDKTSTHSESSHLLTHFGHILEMHQSSGHFSTKTQLWVALSVPTHIQAETATEAAPSKHGDEN